MLFRDIPIQKKLRRIILLITGIILLVTSTAFFAYEFYSFRETIKQKLSTLGKVIATNSTAALAFDDNQAAYEILLALRAEPHITAASLYDEKGKLFSQYPKDLPASEFPPLPKVNAFRYSGSSLECFQPVTEGNRQLGTIYLKSDLGGMYERFRLFGITTGLVIMLSLLLAYLLSRVYQKSISKPILALADTAKTISVNRDFSHRAVKSGNDELGSLTDSFNEMLQKIEEQNNNLQEFNKELDKREKLFRAIIEKGADMKTLSTPDGIILYASPSVTKILGYENQEFMAIPLPDLIHPGDIREFIEKKSAIVKTPGKSFYRQQRMKHKNGIWIWCEGTVTNMLHEPAVGALVANFRDISARKHAEEAIKLAQANYREIFDKTSDAILVFEMHTGKVIEVNQRAYEITGYSRKELLKSDGNQFTTDNQYYTVPDSVNYFQKAAAGEPQLFEWTWKNKDGSINWLEVNLKKATIAGKERILAFFREINDRKKDQFEIQKLNEELEQKVVIRTEQLETVNKELEAFSYSVSHDLRAPLRAINGFARMLGENYGAALDHEGTRLLNRIEENAKRMGFLIDDLLEFSRLGRKEIHKSQVQMTELTEATLAEINTTMNHKAAVKIHKLHPAIADSILIKQVMINLLSNAIKYSSKTEKPFIEIKSQIGENEITYCVSDNGVGFNNQYTGKLFGIFQRLHLQSDYEGTGVGLALVKRIINKHGGRVWAEGELNKGATFYFSLPVTNNN